MKTYNIEQGLLHNDLDCLYDSENNKIDVYTDVAWTASKEDEYKSKENIINSFKYEDDLINAFAWCDISGFDYWKDDLNYVSIDVILRKRVEDYSQEEIETISALIIMWNDYFRDYLV